MASQPVALIALGTENAVANSLMEKAYHYMQKSKSDATRRAYAADWRDFTSWCAAHALPSMPATPQTIALYLADLANVAKPATINRRMAAISKAHQVAGYESPCSMRNAAVSEVLSGIRREKGTAQVGKAALLTADLRRMIDAMPDSILGKRDAALLLLGYAGGFRRSELAALTISDVEFCDEGLRVTLRRSKTDQEGQGRKIGIPYGSDPRTCPVRVMRRWLEASGIVDGPLFRDVRFGRIAERAIIPQVVLLRVKCWCEAAGLDAAKFGAHSLRAGLATQAAINGASERSIMKQTGHRSTAMVRRYIRDSELFRENAAVRLGL